MRVLQVYKNYLPSSVGGVENAIHAIACSTQKFGVTTTALSTADQRNIEIHTIDHHQSIQCPTTFTIASTPCSITAIKCFNQLLKQHDLIHYHYPWPFMDLMHLTVNIKQPCLVTYHSDIVKQRFLLKLYKPVMKQFLKRVDHIVATSPQYLASSPILQRYLDKTSIIPIGLNQNHDSQYPQPNTHHWQHLPKRFFLFVGVLRYYKGLHILLQAAKMAQYPIIIAGAGPEETKLKALALKLNLHHVKFVGHISNQDKVTLIMNCFAMIFPSHLRSEAFGISLLESAMFGKPIISCDIGTGTSFINVNQETGYIVAPNNSQALAQAMQALWQHPDKTTWMGQNAHQRFKKMFTADKMGYNYYQLYEKLLCKKT